VVVGESPFVLFHFTQSATGDPPFPGGVGGVRVARAAGGSDLTLSWDPACGTAGDFAVYEGTLGSWYSHQAVACTTGGILAATVAPGVGGRYYLVTPLGGSTEGNCGSDSAGTQRPLPAASCQALVDQTDCQ
jgi:hypothetical protein